MHIAMSRIIDPFQQRQKPVTLQTIASRIGVSTATVSLALRDSDSVAESTREAVKVAARELGYIYNRSAASLRTSSTGIIGVAFHHLANPFLVEALTAIERSASAQRRSVIVAAMADDRQRQREVFERFKEYRLDGVILCSAMGSTVEDLEPLVDAGIPIALMVREIKGAIIDYVGSDNARGVALAMQHLFDLGHRRIAMIGGPSAATTSFARREGYRRFLADNGLPNDPTLETEGPMFAETGFLAIQRLVQQDNPPTAAVCFNDAMAFGALNGLRFMGIEPGRDFSVVGFDDLKEAALVYPGLTTIRSGQMEIGERATKLLFSRIADPDGPVRQIFLRPELVVRGTTAPVPVRSTGA